MEDPSGTGQHADGVAASFRCAACSEMAAMVKTLPAGCEADMGEPVGLQSHRLDGIIVDYFGKTAWKPAEAQIYRAVGEILSSEAPDPAALRRIDWELAPFYCPDCAQNYCRTDWHIYVLVHDDFYDCTMGRCPLGHEHMINDGTKPHVWGMATTQISRRPADDADHGGR